MNKKSSNKRTGNAFGSSAEMDSYLESQDIGDLFAKFGSVEMPKTRKISLDIPEWLIKQLDMEAVRAGVSLQPLIKLWLIQKLDVERKKRSA